MCKEVFKMESYNYKFLEKHCCDVARFNFNMNVAREHATIG